MNIHQNVKSAFVIYLMMFISLLLAAGVIIYLSHSVTTEQALLSDKNIITLNGPWKFAIGDNIQYAQCNYDDLGWETIDLTAPPGAHDGDVGLSGYIPGWSATGHPNYAGYAWYRLKVRLDNLPASNNLALAAPPAVDDAYQLFINGSLVGSSGNFFGKVPTVYSIQPRMFVLPESVKKEKIITIAFRVWMSSGHQAPDVGGIHIAPALGEKTYVEKKYRFQWNQTIKGYIVEVVLPIMFVLLAITMFLLNNSRKQKQTCKWFIVALILLGLIRLNQAVYFWFQIESGYQSTILSSVILRPLLLGSWLMAWREWFELRQPKRMPEIIAILTVTYMAFQLFELLPVSKTLFQTHLAITDYIRPLFLILLVFITYQGMRKKGIKNLLVLIAIILVAIGLFPKEVSALHIIPGIWFPYGVGVSRGQFFYAAFVFVMYGILIQKTKELN
jgi:hypothetical protein